MNLFNKIFKEKNNFFHFKSNGNIWRLFLNNSGMICGEIRELDKKNVDFFSINYKERIVNFKDLVFEEKWWISIEFINNDIMFLSKFRKPDMPDQSGIVAVNILNGDVLWENKEMTFLYGDEAYTYAYRQMFETKKYFRLNSMTGELLDEMSFENALVINDLKDDYNELLYDDCLYPNRYEIEDTSDPSVDSLLKEVKLNKNISGYIEYIHFNNLLLFNYHEKISTQDKNSGLLSNNLVIYDLNNNKSIFEEKLNLNVNSYTPDSFFIKGDYLFYVKNKNELFIRKLEEFENNN